MSTFGARSHAARRKNGTCPATGHGPGESWGRESPRRGLQWRLPGHGPPMTPLATGPGTGVRTPRGDSRGPLTVGAEAAIEAAARDAWSVPLSGGRLAGSGISEQLRRRDAANARGSRTRRPFGALTFGNACGESSDEQVGHRRPRGGQNGARQVRRRGRGRHRDRGNRRGAGDGRDGEDCRIRHVLDEVAQSAHRGARGGRGVEVAVVRGGQEAPRCGEHGLDTAGRGARARRGDGTARRWKGRHETERIGLARRRGAGVDAAQCGKRRGAASRCAVRKWRRASTANRAWRRAAR